jgi:ABC-type lipoprotein export system ATPase subunit
MKAIISNETQIERSARVLQLEGIFDVPPSQRSRLTWDVNLPIEDKPWSIGAIIGPSGAGKSTIARHLFGQHMKEGMTWPTAKSVLDAFPKAMSIKDITELLNSVGFSSPPSWVRPFSALSNGEQFRVSVARTLAEADEIAVVDEFTSVIDRQVAQIGSYAVAKTIRRNKRKFVAVSCHSDILDWLQPDWIYQPHLNLFQWRDLQQRPDIKLTVRRVDKAAWQIFKRHHYLNASLASSAQCFVALVGDSPAAFTAVLFFPHPTSSGWREHRTVCLPDYQGVGIGNTLSAFVAGLYRSTGKPYRSTTGHPGMIASRLRSGVWRMFSRPGFNRRSGRTSSLGRKHSFGGTQRLTASFEYTGPALFEDARQFGVI